jgi:aminopeptidase N
MTAYPKELQAVIAQELARLSATAKDVEAHLEDALGSDTLQETTITGIQQIDEIAQVLEQLAALLSHASKVAPMPRENATLLIDVVKLPSLQHRLQGIAPSGGAQKAEPEDIEFF